LGHSCYENAKALLRFTEYIHQIHRVEKPQKYSGKISLHSQGKNRNMEMTKTKFTFSGMMKTGIDSVGLLPISQTARPRCSFLKNKSFQIP